MEIPPNWQKLITPDLIKKSFSSNELRATMKKAQEGYAPWDVFRHYKFPAEIKPEEAWAILKLSYRNLSEETPIKSKGGGSFSYAMTKTLYKRLSYIDTHTAGFIRTLTEKPSGVHKEQLIVSGLSEEAIASSQIEGANTTRKVAKEMIYSGRKPRNRSEQMIVNNYLVMQQLDNLSDVELSEKLLLEIQSKITKDTLDDPGDAGRFRVDADEIVVKDPITGDIVFVPPTEKEVREGLAALLKYANTEEVDGESFVHPVVKATVIHFWFAYLHPFPDGNGRTARAVFYWYLRKSGYWLFQYLSVSRIIQESRVQYDNAFLYSEHDDNDLTYFILYITKAVERAVDQLLVYYEKKLKEADRFKRVAAVLNDLNERQIALLSHLEKHPEDIIEIKAHQTKNGIAYETARKDLLILTEKGLVAEVRKGNKKIYISNDNEVKKLFQKLK